MKNLSPIFLFLLTLALYALMNYGGIRSPDSDVVFRVAESLSARGSFDVPEHLEGYRGFGVALGIDGRNYALFGPAQSVLSVPLVKLAGIMNRVRWFNSITLPLNHYVDEGLMYPMPKRGPAHPELHGSRFIVSFFNMIITALGVLVFWLIVKMLASSFAAANLLAVLFAFGSLAWPYSGTYFSEPLTTLFTLGSLYFLVRIDFQLTKGNGNASPMLLLIAGLCLGFAISAHITAVLFLPFFVAYCGWLHHQNPRGKQKPIAKQKKNSKPIPNAEVGKTDWPVMAIKSIAIYLTGILIILVFLLYYNYARFGEIFETGRTVGESSYWASSYSHFVLPWQGLRGLLIGQGKGLLLFSPSIVVGLFGWRKFHRVWPKLSTVLILAAIFRFVFISTRSDWHGGFSLGPRFLVVLIPFLIMPASIWIDELIRKRKTSVTAGLGTVLFLCISQQIYFCLGDVFLYLHYLKWDFYSRGVDLFKDNWIYLNWDTTPLFGLLSGPRGPFLLQGVGVNNKTLLSLLMVMVAIIMGAWVYHSHLRNRKL